MINKNATIIRKRIKIGFFLFGFIVLLLCLRIAYIQFVKGDEYKSLAINQQKKNDLIKAQRGKILDRNGLELAVNIQTYSVWITPRDIKEDDKKEKEKKIKKSASSIAEILGQDKNEMIENATTSKSTSIKLAKNVTREKAEKIWDLELPGVLLREEVQRNYPMGSMMSKTLGGVNDDNVGVLGIEAKYDDFLRGVNGKWVKNTDVKGNALASGTEEYFQPVDGSDVVLTIDRTIQMHVEDTLKKSVEKYNARSASCIVTNPKTGEILAIATYPSFDGNDKRKLVGIEKSEFNKLSVEEQGKYYNELWRNPIMSDVYEPGSTMKLLTVASSIEEGVAKKEDTFYCKGYHEIAGYQVKCSVYPKSHGTQTLYQGVANSCNPVFMELGRRIGKDKFYSYLDLFGLTGTTGVDFPGESRPIIIPKEKASQLDVEIMAFGQTSAVTPIQMITAVSAFGNDGKTTKPHLVKKINNSDGTTVDFETEYVRQSVSKKTADEVCAIMENNVEQAYRKNVFIDGYRIGGKTGTAQIAKKDGAGYESGRHIISFLGMAPMNNPEIAILYMVDVSGYLDSPAIAGKPASELIKKIMDYHDIKPNKSAVKKEDSESTKDMVSVPSVVGMKFSEAEKKLKDAGFNVKVTPEQKNKEEFTVKDQYPSSGSKAKKNSVVYIYRQ
ncbi:MAG: penicillin-binding transpeptidase domain-containing protein [Eubacteriales bacterium]|nr:penicillin-binding transpeptidase domain-containing protein [Eubacteriales bacterium]MDY3332155.1 penicillin-binding transpeptidase domain-containing protein [Gallibacter sp.]